MSVSEGECGSERDRGECFGTRASVLEQRCSPKQWLVLFLRATNLPIMTVLLAFRKAGILTRKCVRGCVSEQVNK